VYCFFAIKCTRFIIKILDDAGVFELDGLDALVGFCCAGKGGEPEKKKHEKLLGEIIR